MHRQTNSALPTPEALKVIKDFDLPPYFIDGWFSVPTLTPTKTRLATSHFNSKEAQVDAFELLSPFFGNPILDGSLRTLDFKNGCDKGCDTCLAASLYPTKLFSFDSLDRLFGYKPFLAMLQPDSLRSGSSGDSLDHPDAIRIFEMILKRTFWLDMKRWFNTRGKERFVIKAYTNFRVYPEEKDWIEQNHRLNRLLNLAKKHPKRFRVIISLPLNRVDSINHQFENFALTRPDIFRLDGKKVDTWSTKYDCIGIQDVRHPYILFTSGRTISPNILKNKVKKYDWVEPNRKMDYGQRGLTKIYLNPDALWLQVYATIKESLTSRTFTPLNKENLEVLSYLPFHPDFPTPPNWPGGTKEERSSRRAQYLKNVNAHKRSRHRVIVK